ncbi:MAG: DUF5050 domain-containing protein [Clostridia bacterium]|nr:DUF5050 domain-containing protein [Clostridia bacterium]MDD4375718.1 DUF5050 domain-containing protein [Clostridia bacterium]
MDRLDYNQDEFMTRKEYLRNKKREKMLFKIQRVRKSTWFTLFLMILIASYVIYQYYIYNTKHRLVENLPEEISSMENYNIYYTSESYAYEGETQLKTMSTTSDMKDTIKIGQGIAHLKVKGNEIYGIKENKLIKIFPNGKTKELKVLIDKNVQAYEMFNDDIYVVLKGTDVETGLYKYNKEGKHKKITDGEVYQLLIDNNNIYVVKKENKNIIKYNKNSLEEKALTNDKEIGYIIQDEKNIYYSDKKRENKIYKIDKNNSKEKQITKGSLIKSNNLNQTNGISVMGIFEDKIYYINENSENKLYKTKIDGSKEELVLHDQVHILEVIGNTIFYNIKDDIGVYRYDIETGISSQITSARVVEFKVSE